ncbi:MAG: GAF domain-containing protein, partial [Anaerolineales bacterium]|nr:GAF domain-containing protein [Anaerolineales bacterium]
MRWPKFLRAPNFTDPHTRRLAGILNFMLWVGLFIMAVHLVLTLVLPRTPFLNPYFELLVALLMGTCLLLLHLRQPRLAAGGYVLGLWLVVTASAMELGQVTSAGVSTLYTVILVAGVLLGRAGGLSVAALSGMAVVYMTWSAAGTSTPDWAPIITIVLNFGLVALMAIIGEHAIRTSLVSAEHSHSLLSQRSAQLQTTADIGLAATASDDVDDFLKAVTQVIADRFALHHVSILTLSQGTSELSLNPLSQGGQVYSAMPSFSLGEANATRSIIAHVARTRKPYLASDVHNDALYLHHPDLGEARSEIAVPIMEGTRLFGVLDVISNQTSLDMDDLNALQVLCTQ